jgi:hypothetical protein
MCIPQPTEENWLNIADVKIYLLPVSVTAVGATISNAHLSKGRLAVVLISMGALCSGLKFLLIWQLIHLLTYFSMLRFIFGHSYFLLISLKVLFIPR